MVVSEKVVTASMLLARIARMLSTESAPMRAAKSSGM